jgi:hypothetical protein
MFTLTAQDLSFGPTLPFGIHGTRQASPEETRSLLTGERMKRPAHACNPWQVSDAIGRLRFLTGGMPSYRIRCYKIEHGIGY